MLIYFLWFNLSWTPGQVNQREKRPCLLETRGIPFWRRCRGKPPTAPCLLLIHQGFWFGKQAWTSLCYSICSAPRHWEMNRECSIRSLLSVSHTGDTSVNNGWGNAPLPSHPRNRRTRAAAALHASPGLGSPWSWEGERNKGEGSSCWLNLSAAPSPGIISSDRNFLPLEMNICMWTKIYKSWFKGELKGLKHISKDRHMVRAL